MRGYIQVASTLLFFAVLYWLATRQSRRARKDARRARTWAAAATPEQRLLEVEQAVVLEDDRLTQVERRLAALEQGQDAPLYRVQ